MKLHLPSGLRKALLVSIAALAAHSVPCTVASGAAFAASGALVSFLLGSQGAAAEDADPLPEGAALVEDEEDELIMPLSFETDMTYEEGTYAAGMNISGNVSLVLANNTSPSFGTIDANANLKLILNGGGNGKLSSSLTLNSLWVTGGESGVGRMIVESEGYLNGVANLYVDKSSIWLKPGATLSTNFYIGTTTWTGDNEKNLTQVALRFSGAVTTSGSLTLMEDAGIAVQNGGNFTVNGSVNGSGHVLTFDNYGNGTLNFNGGGTLGGLNLNPDREGVMGRATSTVNLDGAFTLNGATTINGGGVLNVKEGCTLTLSGSITTVGTGVLNALGSITMLDGSSISLVSGSSITSLNINGNATLGLNLLNAETRVLALSGITYTSGLLTIDILNYSSLVIDGQTRYKLFDSWEQFRSLYDAEHIAISAGLCTVTLHDDGTITLTAPSATISDRDSLTTAYRDKNVPEAVWNVAMTSGGYINSSVIGTWGHTTLTIKAGLNLSGNGIWISDGYSGDENNYSTYAFTGAVTGDGSIRLDITKSPSYQKMVFSGDMSAFSGDVSVGAGNSGDKHHGIVFVGNTVGTGVGTITVQGSTNFLELNAATLNFSSISGTNLHLGGANTITADTIEFEHVTTTGNASLTVNNGTLTITNSLELGGNLTINQYAGLSGASITRSSSLGENDAFLLFTNTGTVQFAALSEALNGMAADEHLGFGKTGSGTLTISARDKDDWANDHIFNNAVRVESGATLQINDGVWKLKQALSGAGKLVAQSGCFNSAQRVLLEKGGSIGVLAFNGWGGTVDTWEALTVGGLDANSNLLEGGGYRKVLSTKEGGADFTINVASGTTYTAIKVTFEDSITLYKQGAGKQIIGAGSTINSDVYVQGGSLEFRSDDEMTFGGNITIGNGGTLVFKKSNGGDSPSNFFVINGDLVIEEGGNIDRGDKALQVKGSFRSECELFEHYGVDGNRKLILEKGGRITGVFRSGWANVLRLGDDLEVNCKTYQHDGGDALTIRANETLNTDVERVHLVYNTGTETAWVDSIKDSFSNFFDATLYKSSTDTELTISDEVGFGKSGSGRWALTGGGTTERALKIKEGALQFDGASFTLGGVVSGAGTLYVATAGDTGKGVKVLSINGGGSVGRMMLSKWGGEVSLGDDFEVGGLQHDAEFQSGNGTLVNGRYRVISGAANFTINTADESTYTVDGVEFGSGTTVIKKGAGTQTLSGANVLGTLNMLAGTLTASGSIATLSGTGGTLAVSGGTLAVTNTTATLTALTLNGTLQLGAGTNNRLTLGGLTIGEGGTLAIDSTGLREAGDTTAALISFSSQTSLTGLLTVDLSAWGLNDLLQVSHGTYNFALFDGLSIAGDWGEHLQFTGYDQTNWTISYEDGNIVFTYDSTGEALVWNDAASGNTWDAENDDEEWTHEGTNEAMGFENNAGLSVKFTGAGETITVSGAISVQDMTVRTSGTYIFNGSSGSSVTINGDLHIASGTLQLGTLNQAATSANFIVKGALDMKAGATLKLYNGVEDGSNKLTLEQGGTITGMWTHGGAIVTGGSLSISNWRMDSDKKFIISKLDSVQGDVSLTIKSFANGGNGSVSTAAGARKLTVEAGVNTTLECAFTTAENQTSVFEFNGGVNFLEAVNVKSGATLTANGGLTQASGKTLTLAGGTLNLTKANEAYSLDTLALAGGALTLSNGATLSAATLSSSSGTTTITGAVTATTANLSGGTLTITDGSTLNATTLNSSSGTTTITGALTATTANLSGGTLTISDGSTLSATTLNSSSDSVINGSVSAGALNITGGTLTLANGASVSGAMSGSTALLGGDLNVGTLANAAITINRMEGDTGTHTVTLGASTDMSKHNTTLGEGLNLVINGNWGAGGLTATLSVGGDLTFTGFLGNGGTVSVGGTLTDTGTFCMASGTTVTAQKIKADTISNFNSPNYKYSGSATADVIEANTLTLDANVNGGSITATTKLAATSVSLTAGTVNAGAIESTTVTLAGGTLNLTNGGSITTLNGTSGNLTTGGTLAVTNTSATLTALTLNGVLKMGRGEGGSQLTLGGLVLGSGAQLSITGLDLADETVDKALIHFSSGAAVTGTALAIDLSGWQEALEGLLTETTRRYSFALFSGLEDYSSLARLLTGLEDWTGGESAAGVWAVEFDKESGNLTFSYRAIFSWDDSDVETEDSDITWGAGESGWREQANYANDGSEEVDFKASPAEDGERLTVKLVKDEPVIAAQEMRVNETKYIFVNDPDDPNGTEHSLSVDRMESLSEELSFDVDVTVNESLRGSGNIVVKESKTLTLEGKVDYTGTITMEQEGTLNLGADVETVASKLTMQEGAFISTSGDVELTDTLTAEGEATIYLGGELSINWADITNFGNISFDTQPQQLRMMKARGIATYAAAQEPSQWTNITFDTPAEWSDASEVAAYSTSVGFKKSGEGSLTIAGAVSSEALDFAIWVNEGTLTFGDGLKGSSTLVKVTEGGTLDWEHVDPGFTWLPTLEDFDCTELEDLENEFVRIGHLDVQTKTNYVISKNLTIGTLTWGAGGVRIQDSSGRVSLVVVEDAVEAGADSGALTVKNAALYLKAGGSLSGGLQLGYQGGLLLGADLTLDGGYTLLGENAYIRSDDGSTTRYIVLDNEDTTEKSLDSSSFTAATVFDHVEIKKTGAGTYVLGGGSIGTAVTVAEGVLSFSTGTVTTIDGQLTVNTEALLANDSELKVSNLSGTGLIHSADPKAGNVTAEYGKLTLNLADSKTVATFGGTLEHISFVKQGAGTLKLTGRFGQTDWNTNGGNGADIGNKIIYANIYLDVQGGVVEFSGATATLFAMTITVGQDAEHTASLIFDADATGAKKLGAATVNKGSEIIVRTAEGWNGFTGFIQGSYATGEGTVALEGVSGSIAGVVSYILSAPNAAAGMLENFTIRSASAVSMAEGSPKVKHINVAEGSSLSLSGTALANASTGQTLHLGVADSTQKDPAAAKLMATDTLSTGWDVALEGDAAIEVTAEKTLTLTGSLSGKGHELSITGGTLAVSTTTAELTKLTLNGTLKLGRGTANCLTLDALELGQGATLSITDLAVADKDTDKALIHFSSKATVSGKLSLDLSGWQEALETALDDAEAADGGTVSYALFSGLADYSQLATLPEEWAYRDGLGGLWSVALEAGNLVFTYAEPNPLYWNGTDGNWAEVEEVDGERNKEWKDKTGEAVAFFADKTVRFGTNGDKEISVVGSVSVYGMVVEDAYTFNAAAADSKISVSGELRLKAATVINVNTEVGGKLRLKNGALTLGSTLSAKKLCGTGDIRLNGGELTLEEGGTLTGELQLGESGTLKLGSSLTIDGGVVQADRSASGGLSVEKTGAQEVSFNVNLTEDKELWGGTLSLGKGVNWALGKSGVDTAVMTLGSSTLSVKGQLSLDKGVTLRLTEVDGQVDGKLSGAGTLAAAGGTLTLAAGGEVGALQLSSGASLTLAGDVKAGELSCGSDGGAVQLEDSSLTVSRALVVTGSGAKLSLSSGTEGEVRLEQGGAWSGKNTLAVDGAVTLELGSSLSFSQGAALELARGAEVVGDLQLLKGGELKVSSGRAGVRSLAGAEGTVTVNGELTVQSGAIGTLAGSGSLAVGQQLSISHTTAALTALTLNGRLTLGSNGGANSLTLGRLTLGQGATLAADATGLDADAALILFNSGATVGGTSALGLDLSGWTGLNALLTGREDISFALFGGDTQAISELDLDVAWAGKTDAKGSWSVALDRASGRLVFSYALYSETLVWNDAYDNVNEWAAQDEDEEWLVEGDNKAMPFESDANHAVKFLGAGESITVTGAVAVREMLVDGDYSFTAGTAGKLSISGPLTADGTVTLAVDTTVSGKLVGTGALVVDGAAVSLGTQSSFGGAVTLRSGSLTVHGLSLAKGALTLGGGTLAVDGGSIYATQIAVTGAVTLAGSNTAATLKADSFTGRGTLTNAAGNSNVLAGDLSGFTGTIEAADDAAWALVNESTRTQLGVNLAGTGKVTIAPTGVDSLELTGKVSGKVSLENAMGAGATLILGATETTGKLIFNDNSIQLGTADKAGAWAGTELSGTGELVLVHGKLGAGLTGTDRVQVRVDALGAVEVNGASGSKLSDVNIHGEQGGSLSGVKGDLVAGGEDGIRVRLSFGREHIGTEGSSLISSTGNLVVKSIGEGGLELDFSNASLVDVLEQHRREEYKSALHIIRGGKLLVDSAVQSAGTGSDSWALLSSLGFNVVGAEGGDLVIAGTSKDVYLVLNDWQGEADAKSRDHVVSDAAELSKYKATVIDEGETLTLNVLPGEDAAAVNNLVGLKGATLRARNASGARSEANVALNNSEITGEVDETGLDHVGSLTAAELKGLNTLFEGTISGESGVSFTKTGKGTLTVGDGAGNGGVELEGNLVLADGGITLQGSDKSHLNALVFAYGKEAAEAGLEVTKEAVLAVNSLAETDGKGGEVRLTSGGSLAVKGSGELHDTSISGDGSGSMEVAEGAALTLAENAALRYTATAVSGSLRLTDGATATDSALSIAAPGAVSLSEGARITGASGISVAGKLSVEEGGSISLGETGDIDIAKGGAVSVTGAAEDTRISTEGKVTLDGELDLGTSTGHSFGSMSGSGLLAGGEGSELTVRGSSSFTGKLDGSPVGSADGTKAGGGTLTVAGEMDLSGAKSTDYVWNATVEKDAKLTVDTQQRAEDLNLDVTLKKGATLDYLFSTDNAARLRGDLDVQGESSLNVVINGGVTPGGDIDLGLTMTGGELDKLHFTLGGVVGKVLEGELTKGEDGALTLTGVQKAPENVYACADKNAQAGGDMLWGAMEYALANTGDLMAFTMSTLGDDISVSERDRALAAVAGASIATLGSALAHDIQRQLSAIRTRAMGTGDALVPRTKTEYHVWLNAESSYHKMQADGLAPGYTLNSWGGTVGVDLASNRNVTMGLALSAMYGDLKVSAADSATGDLDTTYVSAFARMSSGKWMHTAVVSGGLADVTLDRTVAHAGGAESFTTQGSTNGYAVGALYELGYAGFINRASTFILQPVVNVELRHGAIRGYSESGSDAGLSVNDISQTTLTFGLGARMQALAGEYALNGGVILESRALLKLDTLDRSGKAENRLLHGADTREVESAKVGPVGVELGAGISLPVGSGSIFLDASVELRSGYTNMDANAGYRISF